MAPNSPQSRKTRASSAPPPSRKDVGKKRKAVDEVTKPAAVAKRPVRPLTAEQIEKEATANKRNQSVQSGIGFGTVEKFTVGMKLLLPETIYPTPDMVRLMFFVLDSVKDSCANIHLLLLSLGS
jgi:hypothetical protein